MKYTKPSILLFLLFLTLNITTLAYASTPTPTKSTTPTPKPSQNEVPEDSRDLENIQKIKDIVASKVAELNLVEKRGIIGRISDVNGMKIVVRDLNDEIRNIDVDELTEFKFSDEKDTGISDLKKGETYSFIGLFNKDTKRLLARSINSTSSIPVNFEGAIVEIDDKNFQIKVVNGKGEEKTIDIQNSTKTSLASKNGDLTKSGFSKLEKNERIIAVGFWDKKDNNLLLASRLIHFEDLPPSKEMQAHVK